MPTDELMAPVKRNHLFVLLSSSLFQSNDEQDRKKNSPRFVRSLISALLQESRIDEIEASSSVFCSRLSNRYLTTTTTTASDIHTDRRTRKRTIKTVKLNWCLSKVCVRAGSLTRLTLICLMAVFCVVLAHFAGNVC